MTGTRPAGDWTGDALAHEGFLFGTDEELLDRVLPFTTEGLSRGEPVLLVAGERARTLLLDALGDDAVRLALVAAAETWWRGGHETLRAYDRDLRALRATTPAWRLVAEPVWLQSDEGRAWSRFEAVANRCYADLPYYSLCMHDTRRLGSDVLDAVRRTHPLTWDGTAPVPCAAYEDPRQFLRSVQPAWQPRPAAATAVVNPAEGRRAVVERITDRWAHRADEVVLAAHELVTNALRVAASAEVACWTEGDVLVVEVADAGPGLPDDAAGYVPPEPGPEGGRGMWLAWSLADDAAVSSGAGGTAIRLHFRS